MNPSQVTIFCGLLSFTLGNKRNELEPPLQSSWEIGLPLLVIGLVFGFSVVLFYMVRTNTERSNTSQITDNVSQRVSMDASSKISARGDYRNMNSTQSPYDRPPKLQRKCCGGLCCKRTEDTGSMKTIPSLDIPEGRRELVVEKLMLYNVPLAGLAMDEYLPSDSIETTKETEITQITKNKSFSTLTSSYYDMIPVQPTQPDVQSTIHPDVQSQQSAPDYASGMKPVQSETLSHYSTTPSGPPQMTDDTQSTSTYFDMIPKAMSSQQSMPFDNYGVTPSQPELQPQVVGSYQWSDRQDPVMSDVVSKPGQQPLILPPSIGLPGTTSYTSAPMKGEPHSTPNYGGEAPSLEQGKDYRIPKYPPRFSNDGMKLQFTEEEIPLSPQPAGIIPEVQSASYYDMIPQTLAMTQSLEEQRDQTDERIGMKPGHTVVQSYFASMNQQHKALDKHSHELGNVREIREKSRPPLRSQPHLLETESLVYDGGSKQTMSPKDSSLYCAMVPTPYRVKDASSKVPEKLTKTKRELVQPVSTATYFMKTYDSAPNVRSQSSSPHLVRNEINRRNTELNDETPQSVSSTVNNMLSSYFAMIPQPEPTHWPTQSTFAQHQETVQRSDSPAQPWQNAWRNDDVAKSPLGSNDTEFELAEPQTPRAFMFGTTENTTVMHTTSMSSGYPFHREPAIDPLTSSSQLPTQGAIRTLDYNPVVGLAHPWRDTQRYDNVARTLPGAYDYEIKHPQSESHQMYEGSDEMMLMHASSTPSVHHSFREPPIVTMSSGQLVPTTDDERRQMHQYLNQFSSIFTYNLKDPIPKDPEALPGRSSTPSMGQHRESRTALAESISRIGATEHSTSSYNYNQSPPATTSYKREQEYDYQAQSSNKRPRTGERAYRYNNVNTYTAHVYADTQQWDRNNIQDSAAKEACETSATDDPLLTPYTRTSTELCCTNLEDVSSTGRQKIVSSAESASTKLQVLNTLPIHESGLSKELGCAMLDFGSNQQTTVPVHESAVSKEIGCENLDYNASQPDTVPIHESWVSKEMGCEALDDSLSKPENVPIKESGMSKELGCANLDDYPSDLAENKSHGMPSKMKCISTGQMHPRKMIITNKAGNSEELACQQLEVASSHDDSQSGEEKLCSPSASEKIEYLHEYDEDNTWTKKAPSAHSVHVSSHRGSETTVKGSSSSPILESSSIKHSETHSVEDNEPCVHSSLQSIMSPTELGASSSVIDTRQFVPVQSSKTSNLNAKESTKVETLEVAFSSTANPVSFTNSTSPSVVDATQEPSTEQNIDQVRKSMVSFKIPPVETDSQGSSWEDYEGAKDLSIIDRPSSGSSQPPKGATLRWKIIIKHKPDELEPPTRLPMLEHVASTEGSPVDVANNEPIDSESRDPITDEEKTD